MNRCDLSGQRVLITGCTGFVGRSLLRFIDKLPQNDKPEVVVGVARSNRPLNELSHEYAWFVARQADCSEPMSPDRDVDLIVHAATPASAALIAGRPSEMASTILATAKVVIDFSQQLAAPPTILFTSSGAVYDWSGRHDPVSELDRSAPPTTDPKSCYGEAKRMSELLFNLAERDGICRSRVARLFAFAGPDLPLDTHFAIGNFVNDVIHDRPIRVDGHPDTMRSYMWHEDMSRWLMTIALEGSPGTSYNVGSSTPVRIGDLATTIAATATRLGKKVVVEFSPDGAMQTPSFYVPDTTLAEETLKLAATFDLAMISEEMIGHFVAN